MVSLTMCMAINAILNSGEPYDDNGHGTHVAGIAGAVGSNSVGIAGVALDRFSSWRASLSPRLGIRIYFPMALNPVWTMPAPHGRPA